jgi:hypothetical protein
MNLFLFLRLLFMTNDEANIKIFISSNILFYVFFYGMKEKKKEQSMEGIYPSILPIEVVATHTSQRFSGLTFSLVRDDVLPSAHIFSLFLCL